MAGGPSPTVRFRYGRSERRAAAGTNLAAALTEGTPPVLQRSVRYHRPRAPFCGTGACTGCLVRVNGVPNVRACRYEPKEGDRVRSENAWPSVRLDLLTLLDRAFPGGIDSVRGFRRPAFARPIYHWVVRRLAAFGSLPDAPPPGPPPEGVRRETDLLIVGAGAAGRAAAEEAVARGLRPLVVDRSDGAPPPGTDALFRTTAIFLPGARTDRPRPFDLVAAADDGRAVRVAARRVIVATGAYDAGLWLADGDRPGVLTAEGAEALEGPARRPPFERALLFGGGPRVAGLLERWEGRVDAVVAPGPIDPEVVRTASEHDVPLYPRSLLLRVQGRRRVRAVEIRTRGRGPRTLVEADALVLAHRRLPNVQLLFQAGAAMRWTARPGAYLPIRSGPATTVPGLFVAGPPAGVGAPALSGASGREAAERAVTDAPPADPATPGEAEPPGEFEGYYAELASEGFRGGRWTACPCEDVGVQDLIDAGERGYRGLEVVKRYTGVGTGLCQGRYCLPEAVLLLAHTEHRTPAEVGYITQRPPVFSARLDALAALPPEEP